MQSSVGANELTRGVTACRYCKHDLIFHSLFFLLTALRNWYKTCLIETFPVDGPTLSYCNQCSWTKCLPKIIKYFVRSHFCYPSAYPYACNIKQVNQTKFLVKFFHSVTNVKRELVAEALCYKTEDHGCFREEVIGLFNCLNPSSRTTFLLSI
jgi:hypothetical protein